MSSSNINSVLPYLRARTEDTVEALGITQFPSDTGWYQVISGLIVQGETIEVADGATVTVPFLAPFPLQVLGIFLQVTGAAPNAAYINNITLDSFDIVNGVGIRTYYWWAIGV